MFAERGADGLQEIGDTVLLTEAAADLLTQATAAEIARNKIGQTRPVRLSSSCKRR